MLQNKQKVFKAINVYKQQSLIPTENNNKTKSHLLVKNLIIYIRVYNSRYIYKKINIIRTYLVIS